MRRVFLKNDPLKSFHLIQTADYVRLFEYVLTVAREIGVKKAWGLLENSIIQRRKKWPGLSDHPKLDGNEVEKAYNLFLLKYLQIPPDQVPIIEKTDKKIVYKSYNFCPVLEACKILGLDTREICKNVYERPTQAFFNSIHPKLRFKRNYERIRPYAEFCEEVITLED